VVGCESCHGGGSAHRGIGPLPFPNPDHERCGQCHNANYPHGNPEQENIVEDFRTSPHTRTLKPSVFIPGTAAVPALCAKCHSDEGAKLYRDVDGDHAALTDALPDSLPPLTGASSVECRTCHQAHRETDLLEAASTGRTSPFNTCTNCHQLLESGSAARITAFHDPTADLVNGDLAAIITDTHFDDPATGTTAAGTTVEGYVVRAALDSACLDCHNPHNADNTVNGQWARSAHGGRIADVKEAAEAAGGDVFAAGVTDASGIAWTHYNWDEGGRAACQRCHTATGASNFMTNPATYNPANNNFSHLSNWTAVGGSSQQELLYCWGCHSDSKGALRNPGAIVEVFEEPVGLDPILVEFPDSASSNVCLSCHIGREIGEVVKTKTGFDNLGFVNSHYLTAGGTVFAVSGYTFGDRDYSIPASDRHDKLGMGVATGDANFDAVRNNYTGGPCVTCHFGSNDGSHTLSPLTQYAANDLALNPACVFCHTERGEGTNAAITWLGDDATAATLQGTTHKARYQAALEALKVQLAADGFNFTPNYPYFGNTNWLSPGDTDVTGNTTGKNNMGTAFNYNLLIHDPGGVAHNRRYTRRLIYDAIDWIDDNNLNYSVSATLNALDPATDIYKASAIAYLLRAQNGDAGDRY
jgi:hypothetical protein